ncbi:MAG: winged helix-turn-helix domain-containing protein [Xanthomonadales bacterium]|nr:winged helix-turn-helix domain-containing protein [Xanthomonadales bacterium]
MIEGVHEFGRFRFVPQARELWRGGERVTLPRRTFECLDYLIAHRDRAVHRDELVQAVFGRPNVSDAQLGQVVLRTRRVLDDDGNAQRMIRTVAGYGYRWVADVATPGADATAATIQGAGTTTEVKAAAGEAQRVLPAYRATSRRRLSRAALAMAFAVALLGVGVFAAWSMMAPRRPGHFPKPASGVSAERLVVLPLQVDGLGEDAWVRLGAMDLVAGRLREAGFGVPPSESVLGLLQGAPGTTAPAQLREATGARLLVQGSATRAARGWKVGLIATPPQGMATPVEFAAADPVQAARGAADLLLAALGHAPPSGGERDAALDETLQRARAAMLANELDTARAILGDSPALAAQPEQLAYRLAQVDFRAGRLDRAEAALDRLLGGAAAQAEPHFRARVLIARGSTRIRRGAFADGGRDFDAALAALAGSGDVPARGEARLGRANSLVAAHRYGDALADFGAARVDLESAGDLLGVARVDANLGMLELYRGRPAAALGYLPGAAERFQSYGALHELLLTLTGLIDAELAMLQRDEAAATLERAAALSARITDPDQRVDLLLNRAQVLTGAGRHREAQAALAQANAIEMSGNRVLRARQRSLQAALAAQEARWEAAATAAAAALADWPVAGADGDRAALVRIAQRALLALGRDEEAAGLFDRSRAVPDAAAEAPGAVAEALAMAEWWQHRGDAARAAAWFNAAVAAADRRGVPAEIVAVAAARAPALLAAGRDAEAAAMIGLVAPWASRDFDAALLQVRLFHALDQHEAWFNALREAQRLAGEREIPAGLLVRRGFAADAPRGRP